jgi:hypothetical protein
MELRQVKPSCVGERDDQAHRFAAAAHGTSTLHDRGVKAV